MKHIPDGGKNFSGDSHDHFHLVLATNYSLMVAEAIEKAILGLGCRPGAFDESFPQIFVSVRDASGLDFSGAFLVSRFQSAPGDKVGGILE